MKHCETFDHTADVGLAARADTLAELFEALGEGLAEFICPLRRVRPTQVRTLSASAEDVELLAHDFLSDLMVTIQTEHFMVAAVRAISIDETQAVGELRGEPYDTCRHEIHTEIKAVTYHQLRIAQEAGAWIGRVILDI